MTLPVKQNSFAALSPQQQEAHRSKIGVRASAILGQFWQDLDTPEVERVLEVEGWQDVLENCSHSEIRASWTAYQKTGPRTKSGKLHKPDAGALYHIIMKARPRPKIAHSAPEPKKERVSKETAAKILQDAGYAPKRMPGSA